jgi:branched-chain amino acid aminotransferase
VSKLQEAEWIWMDGELVQWHEAKIHVLSLAVQFGLSVFEGVRCYTTPAGPAIFRLRDHLERLFHSARVFHLEHAFSLEQLTEACKQAVERNGLGDCYIRPMVMRGYGAAGMSTTDSPVQVVIPAWPWGAYLGPDALDQGVDVCVSSWQRAEPNTFPIAAKAAGNYNNSMLIKHEATVNGFAEGIALGTGGMVSEASGQNVFLVRKGTLVTPTVDGSLLAGITRDTVLVMAAELGIPVREQPIPRETLYMADEIFLTGTASEIVPIRSVDRTPVGSGKAGPVTRRLQKRFMEIVRGATPDVHGWLEHSRGSRPAVGKRETVAS